MSSRAAFAAALGAVLLLALVPWSTGPLRRLAGGEGETGRVPDFDVPLRIGDVLLAEPRIPDGARYFVDAADRSPLEQGNLKAVGQLYLSRALPVLDPARADWRLELRGGDVVVRRG